MFKQKLLDYNINPSYLGFEFLNYAITLYDPLINGGAIGLYKAVTTKYGKTSSQVERDMRHAIKNLKYKDDTLYTFIARVKTLYYISKNNEKYSNG